MMNDEMKLRYFYFLTQMSCGDTKSWKTCYQAWHTFGNSLDVKEYSKLMERVRALHNKYKIVKEKP